MLSQNLPISNVLILLDGAIVTHYGKIALKQGEQQITISNLSEFLDEESIKVKGKGSVTLIDVTPKMHYVQIKSDDLANEDKAIESVKAKIREKELEQQIVELSIITLDETIKSIGQGFGEWGLKKGLSVTSFNEYYNYYQKGARVEREKKIKIDKELEQLQNELSVLEHKRSQLTRTDKKSYEIELTLDAKKEGEIELELSYSTRNAGWSPFYSVDLNVEEAHIQRMARIYNRTGKDWKNVKVSITTSTTIPISIAAVNPMYVSLKPVYSPPKSGGSIRRSMAPASPKRAMMLDAAPTSVEEKPFYDEPEMGRVATEVSIAQTGHQRFDIESQHDIDSSTTPKTLHLDQIILPIEKSYYWSAMSEKLILTHELCNQNFFLLAGKVKVFIAGEFISQSELNLIHPKEKFTLGVVESYDLKVEKKLVKRDVSKKGLVKGKKVLEFGYEIKIENRLKKPVKVKIIDRVPHSVDENIEVEVTSLSILANKSSQGIHEWEFDLKEDEKTQISYEYIVKHPPERILTPSL